MSQIEELRQIIVGDNTEQLAELKDRIENVESRTRDVLEVLPPAIDAGVKQDDRLLNALKVPVSESIKRAVREEPVEYAEILYPVMGPSIRRAIAQAISSLLITINQSVESATSVKGVRLRLQSIKTGVPYAELALRQSLKYKVEHIYLIDRDTGMMISEVAAEGTSSLDSDAVSAMFSAIQSFVQDSFSKNEEDRLTDLKVGEHKVWIVHGPNAMLACVILGEAPQSLKHELYDALDRIRSDYSTPLNEFSGDGAEFVGVEEQLRPLLHIRMREDTELIGTTKKSPSLVQRALFALCVLGLGYLLFSVITNKSKLRTVEQYLNEVPGLVTTKIYTEDARIVVEGLQDPLAQIPYSILEANDIDGKTLDMRTAPFRSLEPAIELQRLQGELSLPANVALKIADGRLTLAGYAPIEWLLDNDSRLRQLASEARLDITQLYPSVPSLRNYFNTSPAQDFDKIIEVSQNPWPEQSLEKFIKP